MLKQSGLKLECASRMMSLTTKNVKLGQKN